MGGGKGRLETYSGEGAGSRESGNQGTSKAVRQCPSLVPQVLLAPVHLEDC